MAGLPVPLWVCSGGIFVVAWVFSSWGTGSREAAEVLEDLQILLIGPMWLLAAIYRRIGFGY